MQLVQNLHMRCYRLHLRFCAFYVYMTITLFNILNICRTYFIPIKDTLLVLKWKIRTFAPFFNIQNSKTLLLILNWPVYHNRFDPIKCIYGGDDGYCPRVQIIYLLVSTSNSWYRRRNSNPLSLDWKSSRSPFAFYDIILVIDLDSNRSLLSLR